MYLTSSLCTLYIYTTLHGLKWSESHSVVSDSLRHHGLYSPWNSPGQNTGVGSLSLLQGIFPIQGSNPGLPHYRRLVYQLSHKWSPRILEWIAYPFSSGCFQSRNWTGVSYIAGGFFTSWTIRTHAMVCVHITHVLCGLHVNKSGKKENTKECTKEILVDHVNNKFKKNKKERKEEKIGEKRS